MTAAWIHQGNEHHSRNTEAVLRSSVDLRRLDLVCDMDAEPLHPVSPRAGRNDPCPCGSGVKFKKCCLPSTLH